MSEPVLSADLLKDWAMDSGFTRAGVAELKPSSQGHHFRQWLDRGDYAAMEWITRRVELREDPRKILPGARSALCVALQYFPLEDEPEAVGDLWPRVARYARGRDYHDIMGKQLRALGRRIEETFPGTVTRSYVDTGPILERELASRAGIGVQGKNTNLLSRGWGSYFLIGEILLTVDLKADDPVADLCGRCTRCLDHCPTGAIPEPYRVDANRCISYWTIEHRGDFPAAVRGMLGDWVFGCDICQEVCPWNYKAAAGSEPRLKLPPERRELDLAGLLALDREEYVRRFTKSPMKRAKLEGLKRNAAVAMGNRGEKGYIPALGSALATEEDPVVRRHAAWALGRISGPESKAILAAAGDSETDPEVRAEIDLALAVCEAAQKQPNSQNLGP